MVEAKKPSTEVALREVGLSKARSDLSARIESIKLTPEEESKIKVSQVHKLFKDKILGLFRVGEFVKEVIDFNDNVNKEVNAAKREYLFSEYFNKCDENTAAVHQLKEAITNPQGNTLINKILKILDDSPPDEELFDHLSAALKHVVESDFVALFDDHRYALGQLEQLTPQAMTVLSDYESWPAFALTTRSTRGNLVTSEWAEEFAEEYSNAKGISDQSLRARILHSISDLIKRDMIDAYVDDHDVVAKCAPTEIGELLIPYMSKRG
jgi:hypothetical protein